MSVRERLLHGVPADVGLVLPRTRWKAWKASRSASGRVWRYCWVVWIWLWPRRSMTALKSAPPAMLGRMRMAQVMHADAEVET